MQVLRRLGGGLSPRISAYGCNVWKGEESSLLFYCVGVESGVFRVGRRTEIYFHTSDKCGGRHFLAYPQLYTDRQHRTSMI